MPKHHKQKRVESHNVRAHIDPFWVRCPTIIKVPCLEFDPTRTDIDLDALRLAQTKPVEEAVEKIVRSLKEGEKWNDMDFGPTPHDEFGAKSLYVDGERPSAAYVDPENIRWDRPLYKDEEPLAGDTFEGYEDGVDGVFCEEGVLFSGSGGANDVCQGKLGDCWLLGAVSVLATRNDLLHTMFWRFEEYKKYGIVVCRFQKDAEWIYVVMDSKIPVYPRNAKKPKPVFAFARDRNELWVPFFEKAYAKLHETYGALVGGYVDAGLKDMTGLISEQLVLREGHLGYHESNGLDMKDGPKGEFCKIWQKMDKYCNQWGSMMGCSIQPHPSMPNKKSHDHSVGNTGLFMKHAYAILDVGVVAGHRLLRLRNPWGMGEWQGKWSDKSKEYAAHEEEIKKVFANAPFKSGKGPNKDAPTTVASEQKGEEDDEEHEIGEVVADTKDGVFLMEWSDWKRYFTHLFAAVDFPDSYIGQRIAGEWTELSAGGNTKLRTWSMNPTFRFHVYEKTNMFLSITQADPRLRFGKEYGLYQFPLAFHICPIVDNKVVEVEMGDPIEGSVPVEKQPSYKFHHSNDIDVTLEKGTYALVPSTYKKDCLGKFWISIYSDKPTCFEGAKAIGEEYNNEDEFPKFAFEAGFGMTDAERQKAIDFELARDRIVDMMHKYNVLASDIMKDFDDDGDPEVSWPEFKKNLIELGFDPMEFEEEQMFLDYEVFGGEDGVISRDEFMKIFEQAMEAEEIEKQRGAGGQLKIDRIPTTLNPSQYMATLHQEAAGLLAGETLAKCCERLTRENIDMAAEISALRQEMQHMAGILLLYGRMFGCYNQPMPANVLSLADVPPPMQRPPLKVGPPGFGGVDVDAMAEGFQKLAEAGGDEFMAVLPWKGAIKEPSQHPKISTKKPKCKLDLEWAYGYSCFEPNHRSNVRYNNAGGIVYHTAAIGVIYDKKKDHQKFNIGDHTDDIMSFTMSSDGKFCATGQMGKPAYICVYNAASGKLCCKLGLKAHQRGVPVVAFDSTNTWLVSVGDNDDHDAFVWSTGNGTWDDGNRVATCKGAKGRCLIAGWDGHNPITGGKKNLLFWTITKNKMKSKSMKPKEKGKNKGFDVYTSSCKTLEPNPNFLTGAASGDIYIWKGQKSVGTIRDAHKGEVGSLCPMSDGGFISGGKDGVVKIWNASNALVSEFSLENLSLDVPICPRDKKRSQDAIRSVYIAGDPSGEILIGTRGGEIIEVGAGRNTGTVIAQSHYKDELWGLATHPQRPEIVVSAGDDKTIRVWNIETHKLMGITEVADMSRSVDISSDGTMIAAGLGGAMGRNTKKGKGGITILDVDPKDPKMQMKERETAKHAKKWTSQVRFSPNGKYCAMGGHDNKVRVYDVTKKLKKQKGRKKGITCNKSSSYITQMDWSEDSTKLQTNDGAYELLFYDATKGKQITSAKSLKDTPWATWTCVLGWPCQGIWPSEADGTDINGTCRSNNSKVLATVDDFGLVKVFRYPCVKDESKFVQGVGHSSHVTCCRFTKDDAYLMTTGGNDKSVFQWKMTWQE